MSSITEKKSPSQIDIPEIREKLANAEGPEYWRGLEELAETESFRRFLRQETPQFPPGPDDAVNRRQFLTLMAASLFAAGLAGCTRPPGEKIVPYVRQPEEIIPGKPLFFATAMPLNGLATGLLVESHMGRPTKVEGNPDHPASLGATDIFAQAATLSLYDPDRSKVPVGFGELATWDQFITGNITDLESAHLDEGASFRILTGTVTSPTLGSQIRKVLAAFPAARWHQYEPAGRDNVREGARLAFGTYVETVYDFERADVILSLDADFLGLMPGSLRYTRQFSNRRRHTGGETKPNRLYMVEASPSTTGAMADHRWPLRQSAIGNLAMALAENFKIDTGRGPVTPFPAPWLQTMIRDLGDHKGRSLVIAGDQQPPVVHAIAHAINAALDNAGVTVSYREPIEVEPTDQLKSLQQLAVDIQGGNVKLLLILGGNPVFTAPADVDFKTLLQQVATRIHVSPYVDETSILCQWHLPETHFLEAWSDTRAFDGTATIMQPLISPLYAGRSHHEVLSIFEGQPGRPGYEIVQAYWKEQHGEKDFERWWERSLHDGLIPATTAPSKAVTVRPAFARDIAQEAADSGLDVVFRPDPTIFDGRFANNGWLQELPKPLTRLTWDNAVLVAPATAERLQLQNEEIVEVRVQGKSVEAPVWILPGHATDSITLHYGYGGGRMGHVAAGCGSDIYPIRTSQTMDVAAGGEIRKTGRRRTLACTQVHHNMEGRNPIRTGTVETLERDEEFVQKMGETPAAGFSLYPRHTELDAGYGWGMSIDLSTCTGCNACVVGCQSENNIPVVGRSQVANGREMHWIRIDRYYHGNLDNPETLSQPVPCMHCENAPCETVCPVGATVHSDEGLNDMVYNRCVGTRYCSNNCPYKVRRFNFLQYSDYDTPVLDLLRNPDVSVRSRGVMEKCTYCVQRINQTKITAEKEDRLVRDGEIRPACQQACPAEAIVFGNINDPESRVSKLKASPLSYGLLAELNTRPRTTYLARITNPNPEIER